MERRVKILWLEDQEEYVWYLKDFIEEVLSADITLTNNPLEFLEEVDRNLKNCDLIILDNIIYLPKNIENEVIRKVGNFKEPYRVGLYVLRYLLENYNTLPPILILTVLGDETLQGAEVYAGIKSLKEKFPYKIIETITKSEGIYEILAVIEKLVKSGGKRK